MADLDRAKVIKGLEDAYRVIEDYVPKSLRGYSRLACCDAIDLLREQEPVKPKEEPYKIVCGSCGEKLAEICGDVDVVWNDDGKYPRYCPGCGQAVKWDA